MKKMNDNNKLAIQMLIAMVAGILVGLLFMAARESFGSDSAVWMTIKSSCSRILPQPALKALWACSTLAASCLSAPCS